MKIKIYVPICYTSNRQVTPIDEIDFFHDILTELTHLFKGLTVIPNCFGTFENPNGLIDHDQITIVEIFTTTKLFHEKQNDFHKLLNQIKGYFRQNSVAYTINNQIFFW
jgi:hypothetical protein